MDAMLRSSSILVLLCLWYFSVTDSAVLFKRVSSENVLPNRILFITIYIAQLTTLSEWLIYFQAYIPQIAGDYATYNQRGKRPFCNAFEGNIYTFMYQVLFLQRKNIKITLFSNLTHGNTQDAVKSVQILHLPRVIQQQPKHQLKCWQMTLRPETLMIGSNTCLKVLRWLMEEQRNNNQVLFEMIT